MFTRNSIVLSNNIKTPLTAISKAVGNILQLTYGQLVNQLFANQEQGFAYDPNDLTTLYQDAAGAIPVTAQGQPVGLMLDKSKGLVLGGELAASSIINSVTIGGPSFTQYGIAAGIKGRTYRITFTISAYSGSADVGLAGPSTNWLDGGTVARASNGSLTCTRTLVAASQNINLYTRSSNQCTFANISVRELSGNHAYQTTSAARPILQDAPRRIDFDAVDDKLITNLPTQLTGCTVIRSVPNVGTQILIDQTIPTTYNDNTDHCGLIMINRALTASETSQITKLFNKAAGV